MLPATKDTKQNMPAPNTISRWNHRALARKFCGQCQLVGRVALNFLDFLVLFYQEKRTRNILSTRNEVACLAAGGRKRTKKQKPLNQAIPTAHPSDSPNWGAPATAPYKTIKASNHATSHKGYQTEFACSQYNLPLEPSCVGPKILRAAPAAAQASVKFS
jgi:hypothetical protein